MPPLAVVIESPRGLWPVFTLFSAAVATAASFPLFPLSPLHVVFVSPLLRWLAIFASVLYQLASALRISSTYSKEHCPSALQAIGQWQMAQAERQQQRASGWQRQQRQQHVQHLLHAGLEVLLQVSSVHDSRAFFLPTVHRASHCTVPHATAHCDSVAAHAVGSKSPTSCAQGRCLHPLLDASTSRHSQRCECHSAVNC